MLKFYSLMKSIVWHSVLKSWNVNGFEKIIFFQKIPSYAKIKVIEKDLYLEL